MIAAMGQNREIGRDNHLPWHLPADLRHFRHTTAGGALIMGRKTFESLPGLLPGREHIVLSKSATSLPGATVCASTEEAIKAAAKSQKNIFVIGGEQVFKLFLPHAHNIILTHIHASFEGCNAFFPSFSLEDFKEISRVPCCQKDRKNAFDAEVVEYSKREENIQE